MHKLSILIMASMFTFVNLNAQSVPNGNFENWSNPNGYLVPDNWETLNDMTSTASVYTVTRGGTASDYYLKLTSQFVSGIGVIPGVAVSGILDINSFSPLSGFPFTFRPTAFIGKWQYMGNSSNDVGLISVYLTKWNNAINKRDTIGFSMQNLNGMIMSWTNFSFPITYNTSANPDSCIIFLNASGANPEAGSYLYADNLDFTGIISGVENTGTTGTFSVIPNPAAESILLDLSGLKSPAEQFEILDISGKVVLSQKGYDSMIQHVSLAQLSDGNYFLRIYSAKGIVTQKFSKR